MTPDRAIETAADYADAMMTARSAKNLLVLVLLLMLLLEMAIFFIARYKPGWLGTPDGTLATTQQVDVNVTTSTGGGTLGVAPSKTSALLRYLTGIIEFLGIALAIVLAFALYLIVMVMLVGRLIGVSRLTAAFLWCIVLIVLLFPWQAFLMQADFKPPGVLYTWEELVANAQFGMNGASATLPQQILKWTRFVVMPLVAVLILLVIQVKSNRGLRQALGEGELVERATT